MLKIGSPMRQFTNRFLLNASWLIKLRWVAVVGQLLTVTGVGLILKLHIPMLAAIAIVISLTAISNLVLTVWFAERQQDVDPEAIPWDLILGLVLIMDMLSLATLLFSTGGPNNPFSLFFFVNVSLCALILNRNWAWAINGLTIFCFALLLYVHHPMEPLDLGLPMIRNAPEITLEHIGIFVAFATCSSVIVYFMTRLTVELQEQQLRLRRAQAHQARSEKLEALGTLSAGAAHELATPLSTIAVVARDVEQAFEEHPPEFPGAEEVIEDVHLIRSQLERCRKILDRMASHAGDAIGESIQSVSLEKLANASLDGLIGRGRVHLHLPPVVAEQTVQAPLEGLSQAIRALVQNALDADPSDRPVDIRIRQFESYCTWRIEDRGSGMTPQELNRISEPFFTTKPPGKGMGLGVYLAQNIVRRLGGSIEFESEKGAGTCVEVKIPLSNAGNRSGEH
jgi:two-component system sensor histidine kinase RegB